MVPVEDLVRPHLVRTMFADHVWNSGWVSVGQALGGDWAQRLQIADPTGSPHATVLRWRRRDHPPDHSLGRARCFGWTVFARTGSLLPLDGPGRARILLPAWLQQLSPDSRDIFVERCELVGVRVPRSIHRNLSVSRRSSVALLEELVGRKQ